MPRNNLRHGDSHTRFHNLWRDMKGRCDTQTKTSFKNYGGRGISYIKDWEKYENFKNDMYESYLLHVSLCGEKQTTLDRIDVNRNYFKENCRWATYTQQANNKRNTHYIIINGIRKSLSAWAKEFNINENLVERRINLRMFYLLT